MRIAAMLGLLLMVGSAAADDLPRFLPANGNNVQSAQGLARTWPAGGPRELWRMEIGAGKSAIAESGGRAYTLTQLEQQQFVICFNPADGKTIWKRLLLSKGNHHGVSGPVTSPIIDGDRLYVFPYECEDNDLWRPYCPCYCLRTSDGSEIWSERKAFNCSEGTTPLIHGDVLYIGGGGRENILAAVDKMTGKLLWKTAEDRDAGHKYVYVTGSSLVYQEIGNIPQIIVPVFRNDVMGIHAKTGRVLWHWKLDRATSSGMVPTPVAIGSRLLLSAFQGGSGFSQCLELTADGDAVTPRLVYGDERNQCNMFHTPSVYEGAVYGFGKGQVNDALQCTRFDDGQLLWQQEGRDWKTDRQLTIADGLIFAVTKQEELVLIEATRVGYKELGRVNPGIPLGLPQQPMIVNGRLYLRGNDTLVCYQVGGER